MSKQAGYGKGEALALNILGMSYWAKGNFSAAIGYMYKMVSIAESLNNPALLSMAYGHTAILFIDMNDTAKALEYNRKAIYILKKLKDTSGVATYSNNTGYIYESGRQFDSALFYYTIAYNIWQAEGNKEWLPLGAGNLSSVYSKTGKSTLAIRYAEEAIERSRDIRNVKVRCHAYLSLARAYYYTGKYAAAIDSLLIAIDIARPLGLRSIIQEAYAALNQNYEGAGDYKKALKYLNLADALKDSILNEEGYLKMARLNTELATAKKDNEIAQKEILRAEAKKASERHLYLFILSVIMLASCGAIFYMRHKKQALQTLAIRQEKELAEMRLNSQKNENKNLKNELEFKNKELVSFTLSLSRKNNFLHEIKEKIDTLNPSHPDGGFSNIQRLVNTALESEQGWEEFKIRFEQVHNDFFTRLTEIYPQLTSNDLRICAFIKLNLSTKQMAALLNIAPASVDISKYRLKKKMNLAPDENLAEFIINF